MAKDKDKDKAGLRPVDEETEKVARYLRLRPDTVEEVEELPPVRIGEGAMLVEMQTAEARNRVKTRTNEPDIGSLIEKDELPPDDEWETANRQVRKIPLGWVALVGCVFGGAVLWSLVAVKRAEERQDLLYGRTNRMIEDTLQEEKDAEVLIAGIEAGLRGFFGAGTLEEMLGHVRHPQRVGPLMEKHYGGSPPTLSRLEEILGMEPVTVGNRANFWVASCRLGDGKASRVLVESVGAGEAKVDWETYVCYQPMGWDDFATKRPGGYTGDFRVYVEADSFHSHEFGDSAVFTSFRLTALGGDETLYGYSPRDGRLARQIEEALVRNGGSATPMILRLNLPNGLESKRGVVIEELVAPRWVYVENPEKDSP